jgi:hypothetical protein
MSASASFDEMKMKMAPGTAVNAVCSSPKVARTANGDIMLVPQPSDDPEDPLVSSNASPAR